MALTFLQLSAGAGLWPPSLGLPLSSPGHFSRQPAWPLQALRFENLDLVSASCTETEDLVGVKEMLAVAQN